MFHQNAFYDGVEGKFSLYQPMIEDIISSCASPRAPNKATLTDSFDYPPGATVTRISSRPETTSVAAAQVQYHSQIAAYNVTKPTMLSTAGNALETQKNLGFSKRPVNSTPLPTPPRICTKPQRTRAPAEDIRNGLLAHTFGATISADWNQCTPTKRRQASCLSFKDLFFWKA